LKGSSKSLRNLNRIAQQNRDVICIAVNVDDIRGGGVPKEVASLTALRHFFTGGSAINAYKVVMVPHRVLIDRKGALVKNWDGTFGKVVEGRHGASRTQGGQLEEALTSVMKRPAANKCRRRKNNNENDLLCRPSINLKR
jgi:hypothetical protein